MLKCAFAVDICLSVCLSNRVAVKCVHFENK